MWVQYKAPKHHQSPYWHWSLSNSSSPPPHHLSTTLGSYRNFLGEGWGGGVFLAFKMTLCIEVREEKVHAREHCTTSFGASLLVAHGGHRYGLDLAYLSTMLYRGYSKLRTHTALGPYGRSMPRSIGPS